MFSLDLKIPFEGKQRKPFLEEGFFYVPSQYEKHHLFGKNLFAIESNFFSVKQPFVIEFCSGNGQWIVEKALQYPDKNWIAVEKRFDRAKKIFLKRQKLHLSNLSVIWGEGYCFSCFYVPNQMISEIFINFPDPWPKRRHAKHRLITLSFVFQLNRILKTQGNVTLSTDDEKTAKNMIQYFMQENDWESVFAEPYFSHFWPEYGKSFFSDLFIKQGKSIFFMQFIKRKDRGRGI